MKINEDILTDEGKIICDLTNIFTNKNREIEKLTAESTEWESKYYDLQEENERLKEIVENLTTMTVCGDRKQIKNTAQYKLDIYKSRNEKVIQYIDSLFNTIDYDDEEFITFETLENIQNLAKYGQLNGGDEK